MIYNVLHISAALVLFGGSFQHGDAKVVVPETGESFRSQPAAFGETLPIDVPVPAHLHVFREDPSLCNLTKFENYTIQPPVDGLPIAILVDDTQEACFHEESIAIAATKFPLVEYVIVYGNPWRSSGVITMLSTEKGSPLGLLYINEDSAQTLLNNMEADTDSDGLIVELDGSLPQDYIRSRKAIVISPKVAAVLSIFGSAYIVYNLLSAQTSRTATRGRNHGVTFNRFLLGLSIADIMSSIGFFLSSWAIPTRSDAGFKQYVWDLHFPGASGTTATCSL